MAIWVGSFPFHWKFNTSSLVLPILSWRWFSPHYLVKLFYHPSVLHLLFIDTYRYHDGGIIRELLDLACSRVDVEVVGADSEKEMVNVWLLGVHWCCALPHLTGFLTARWTVVYWWGSYNPGHHVMVYLHVWELLCKQKWPNGVKCTREFKNTTITVLPGLSRCKKYIQ